VYGLIRQESRFIVDAQSHVGASGLMQVMPATARWTAKKVGLSYSPSQISDIGTNLTLGMSYLHLVLNDFNSPAASLLAAAAYNAGPSRSRAWRAALTQSGAIDAAIWIENIPFNETRDYVKKVLVNTHLYAQIYPQLLANKGTVARRFQDRLAAVSARDAQAESENKDLP
jgi:soluble lytic murein transglycosylase